MKVFKIIQVFSFLLIFSLFGCDNSKKTSQATPPKPDDTNKTDTRKPEPSSPSSVRYRQLPESYGRCAIEIQWQASQDDKTPPEKITYILLIQENEILQSVTGETKMIYEFSNSDRFPVRISVLAKDEEGNKSAPSKAISFTSCPSSEEPTTPDPQDPPEGSGNSEIPRPQQTNVGGSNTNRRLPPGTVKQAILKGTQSPHKNLTPINRGDQRPPYSEDYEPKIDYNWHRTHPNHPTQHTNGDHLAAEYVRIQGKNDKPLDYLVRWNPTKLPVKFSLHPSAEKYRKAIVAVVDELNGAVKTKGLSELVELDPQVSDAEIADYNTQTIRIERTPPQGALLYGVTYFEANLNTGEIVDADIVLYEEMFESFDATVEEKFGVRNTMIQRLQRTVMHELLHALGKDHNHHEKAKKEYNSIMSYLSIRAEADVQRAINHKLNRESGKDYDLEVLRYLYDEEAYKSLKDIQATNFQLVRVHPSVESPTNQTPPPIGDSPQ